MLAKKAPSPALKVSAEAAEEYLDEALAKFEAVLTTEVEHGEIRHVPLRPVIGYQHDPISAADAELSERLGQRAGLGEELAG